MTLTEAQSYIESLIKECEEKGIKPNTVELLGVHGASGSMYELDSMWFKESDQEDDVEDLFGIPHGNFYVSVYIGN